MPMTVRQQAPCKRDELFTRIQGHAASILWFGICSYAVALERDLPITLNGRFRSFTLPRLQAYEVIVLE